LSRRAPPGTVVVVAEHEQAPEPGPQPAPPNSVPATALALAPATGVREAIGPLTPGTVLQLQRTAGNAAVGAALRRSPHRLVGVGEAAAKLREARSARSAPPPSARFRVPTPDEVKRLYTGGTLPQSVIEDAMRRALRRMDIDIALRTGADDVMTKLFPKPGTFDETAWAGVLGTDTMDVYKSAADAEAKLRPGDKAKLDAVARDAADEIDKAMADTQGLKEVFGSKWKSAQTRYGKAKEALKRAMKNSDKAIDTDYNRDDPQTNLGGWANFPTQHIHLTGDVAEVVDRNEAIITLIHESCHLAHPDVDDHGYYGSEGFEAMSENLKVNNAAHYEELPARSLKTSRFAKVTFTPGKKASGAKVTLEDEVRRAASEYLRKAWDAAVDAHAFVRDVARKMAADPKSKAFATAKKSVLEVSKMEHLTIHLQQPKPTTVTTLDLSLSEGVAHAMSWLQDHTDQQAVPSSGTRKQKADAVVDGAIADYGELTGNAADDRKLVDWLVKHYRKGF
jgi:hypothetical protein